MNQIEVVVYPASMTTLKGKTWSNVPCSNCTYLTRTSNPFWELQEHWMTYHKVYADLAELMANRRRNTAEHHCETCGREWERRKS